MGVPLPGRPPALSLGINNHIPHFNMLCNAYFHGRPPALSWASPCPVHIFMGVPLPCPDLQKYFSSTYNALRIRSKTGGKLVCRRDCLLNPLVVRRFATRYRRMVSAARCRGSEATSTTIKSGAARATTDFNKMIAFCFYIHLTKRLGPGCHLN